MTLPSAYQTRGKHFIIIKVICGLNYFKSEKQFTMFNMKSNITMFRLPQDIENCFRITSLIDVINCVVMYKLRSFIHMSQINQ